MTGSYENKNHNSGNILTLPPDATELSHQRAAQLWQASEQLSTESPEIAGINVMGSVSRGEAREDSDVDLIVFVEPSQDSKALQNFSLSSGEHNPMIEVRAEDPDTLRFNRSVSGSYGTAVWQKMWDQDVRCKIDTDVLPIDADLMDAANKSLLKSAGNILQKSTERVAMPRTAWAIFLQSVGPNRLDKYRQQTLDTLAASGETGEQAWAMIRKMVVAFEKGRDRDYDEHTREIPQTIAEAQTLYSPQNS